jgi:hypothetical protein
MSPHTPGPWHVGAKPAERPRSMVPIRSELGSVVAYVNNSTPETIAQANGRLIAAAPRLADLLRRWAAEEPLLREEDLAQETHEALRDAGVEL